MRKCTFRETMSNTKRAVCTKHRAPGSHRAPGCVRHGRTQGCLPTYTSHDKQNISTFGTACHMLIQSGPPKQPQPAGIAQANEKVVATRRPQIVCSPTCKQPMSHCPSHQVTNNAVAIPCCTNEHASTNLRQQGHSKDTRCSTVQSETSHHHSAKQSMKHRHITREEDNHKVHQSIKDHPPPPPIQ